MNEKRTLGEFIKENKGKIIKGTLIVAAVAVGVVIVIKTMHTSAAINKEGLEILDGLTEGFKDAVPAIGDTIEIIG